MKTLDAQFLFAGTFEPTARWLVEVQGCTHQQWVSDTDSIISCLLSCSDPAAYHSCFSEASNAERFSSPREGPVVWAHDEPGVSSRAPSRVKL